MARMTPVCTCLYRLAARCAVYTAHFNRVRRGGPSGACTSAAPPKSVVLHPAAQSGSDATVRGGDLQPRRVILRFRMR